MLQFFDPPPPLWQAGLFIYGFLVLRYVVLAGGAFLLFCKWLAPKIHSVKLDPRPLKNEDAWREIRWSMLTLIVFSLNGVFIVAATRAGWTQLSTAPLSELSLLSSLIAVLGLLLFHDLYFYVIHRSMHHPLLYQRFHEVHHRSLSPTPWAAFSFHPLEAVVESGVVTLMVFLFPIHVSELVAFQVISLLMNIYGHLGYDFATREYHESHRILRWFNTTRSHQHHHRRFNTNYGLYTLLWDRILGTYQTPTEIRLNREPRHPESGTSIPGTLLDRSLF